LTKFILVFAALLTPSLLRAQIVAPAGRTLFNRTVMVRSFVRIDNFDEPAPGQRVRQFVNPYAVVWGAYPNLSLTFVAPLVILNNENRNDPSQDFTRTSFADGLIFARYDLLRKNVPGGFTRLLARGWCESAQRRRVRHRLNGPHRHPEFYACARPALARR
jgi:hypothetical protein